MSKIQEAPNVFIDSDTVTWERIASNRLKAHAIAGGGSVAWGAITGTLSDQTDLQADLDAKANLTDTRLTQYIVVFSLQGAPPNAIIFPVIVFNRSVTFAANFSGSYGKCLTNPTATATYTVKKNGSTIGTVAISTGGSFTFATSGGTSQSFSAGDYMTILTPATDATLSDVMLTIVGSQ